MEEIEKWFMTTKQIRALITAAIVLSSIPVLGQDPIFIDRYVCESATDEEYIYDGITGRESDGVCNAGTKLILLLLLQ
jgi:hypothetical protein